MITSNNTAMGAVLVARKDRQIPEAVWTPIVFWEEDDSNKQQKYAWICDPEYPLGMRLRRATEDGGLLDYVTREHFDKLEINNRLEVEYQNNLNR